METKMWRIVVKVAGYFIAPGKLIAIPLAYAICKLVILRGYKNYLLANWMILMMNEEKNYSKNYLHQCFAAMWFKTEYLREPDPDKREEMKDVIFGGETGVNWARNYRKTPIDMNSTVGNINIRESHPFYDEIENTLRNSDAEMVVVQIGCSSGREIAYLAKRFPGHHFIGTDIYSDVVDDCNKFYDIDNLSFDVSSAKSIHFVIAKQRKYSIVFSSGSLQYVQPEHMTVFFQSLGQIANVTVVIVEPGDKLALNSGLTGSKWRGYFSYTHNYSCLAEEAGWITQKKKLIEIHPIEDPAHGNTVHSYFVGNTTVDSM